MVGLTCNQVNWFYGISCGYKTPFPFPPPGVWTRSSYRHDCRILRRAEMLAAWVCAVKERAKWGVCGVSDHAAILLLFLLNSNYPTLGSFTLTLLQLVPQLELSRGPPLCSESTGPGSPAASREVLIQNPISRKFHCLLAAQSDGINLRKCPSNGISIPINESSLNPSRPSRRWRRPRGTDLKYFLIGVKGSAFSSREFTRTSATSGESLSAS